MAKDFPDLALLKAGDPAAWDEAFRHLWPMALRAAQHPEACLVAWEAEDVASEAILEVIAQMDRITSAAQAKAFVVTIAYRRAISLARRKSAVKRRLPDVEPLEAVAPDGEIGKFTDLERREMIVLLRRALDVLDPDTRLYLLEKIGQELTYEEISRRHGVPLGTVCTRVARGLKRIREQLMDSPPLMKELKEYLR